MRGIKTKNQYPVKSMIVTGVLVTGTIVLLHSVWGVYQKYHNAKQTLTRMETEVTTLKEREALLTDSLEELNTPEGVSFELRKKLNVAASGEQVAIIVRSENEKKEDAESTSLWQKIKNWFD